MSRPQQPDLRHIDLNAFSGLTTCIFLDFDGTLVDFANHPDDVVLDKNVMATVKKLHTATSGSLAIISGRVISDIDKFFYPNVFPAAGVHGLIRRTAEGALVDNDFNSGIVEEFTAAIQPFAVANEGVLIESKPGSVAVHYRQRPDLEDGLRSRMTTLVRQLDASGKRLKLLEGKMVFEARSGGASKGTAIAAFMEEQQFRGRIPIFAGDDTTDEDGFRAVNARKGLSIKIGAGATDAAVRFATIGEFHIWLHWLAARLGETRNSTSPG